MSFEQEWLTWQTTDLHSTSGSHANKETAHVHNADDPPKPAVGAGMPTSLEKVGDGKQ